MAINFIYDTHTFRLTFKRVKLSKTSYILQYIYQRMSINFIYETHTFRTTFKRVKLYILQ